MSKIEIDLNLVLAGGLVVVSLICLAYMLFDVNYFIRTFFTVVCSKLYTDKKRVDETTECFGICTSQDLDIFFNHMNNARFVRELDIARLHYYERTGLIEIIRKMKGLGFQTASNIRYRRTIPLFASYKITTKLIYWEERAVYLEHQFIALSDGFISAAVLSKQGFIGVNIAKIITDQLGKEEDYRPEQSPELECWIKSIELSSARLRKRDALLKD